MYVLVNLRIFGDFFYLFWQEPVKRSRKLDRGPWTLLKIDCHCILIHFTDLFDLNSAKNPLKNDKFVTIFNGYLWRWIFMAGIIWRILRNSAIFFPAVNNPAINKPAVFIPGKVCLKRSQNFLWDTNLAQICCFRDLSITFLQKIEITCDFFSYYLIHNCQVSWKNTNSGL